MHKKKLGGVLGHYLKFLKSDLTNILYIFIDKIQVKLDFE